MSEISRGLDYGKSSLWEKKLEVNWRFVLKNSFIYLLTFYLLMIGSKSDKLSRNPTLFWTNIILLIIFGGISLLGIIKKKGVEIHSESLIAFFVFIFIGLITTIQNSTFWKSIHDIYFCLFALVIMLAFQKMRLFWSEKELLMPILVVGGLINSLKLFRYIDRAIRLYFSSEADLRLLVSFRGSSPNISAAFANVIFLLAIWEILAKKKKKFVLGYYFLALVSLTSVFLTGSRGGMIGLLAGITAIFVFYFQNTKIKLLTFWKTNKISLLVFISIIGLFFVLFIATLFISGRIERGLGIRFEFWKIAFQGWKENPWLGSGINTAGDKILTIISIPPGDIHNHSHSIYFNLLAETGTLGLFAFLSFIVYVGRTAINDYRENLSIRNLATLSILTALLSHGLVDSLYKEPYLLWLYFMFFGIALPVKTLNIKTINGKAHIWLISVVWIFTLVLGGFLGAYKSKINRVFSLANRGEYKQAESGLYDIQKISLNNGLFHQQAGLVISNLAIQEVNDDKRLLLIQNAISEYELAVISDPNWGANHLNLGVLYWLNGEDTKALMALKTASNLSPKSAMFKLISGVVMEDIGNIQSAEENYQWLQEHRSYWSDGPFWLKTTLRKKVYFKYQKQRLIEREFSPSVTAWKNYQPEIMTARERVYYIESLIEQDLLINAKEELESLRLITGSPEFGVELIWLEASILAAEADFENAYILGLSAFDKWQAKSSRGPGGKGYQDFGLKFYRSDAMQEDLIPFVVSAPINGQWLDRSAQLEEWNKLRGTK